MQLLNAPGVSAAQFVSISLLLKPTAASSNDVGHATSRAWIDMVEPMVVLSPIATVSQTQSLESLKEMHAYLTDFIKVALSPRSGNSVAADFLREDEMSFNDNLVQVFRPLRCAGMGLYYRLLRPGNDNSTLTKFYSMVISSSRNSTTSTKHDPLSGLYGVIICVGITGAPYGHRSSSIHYTMAQRTNDVLIFLASSRIADATSAKALLYTYLLSDDECRKTDDMVKSPSLLIVPEPNDSETGGGRNLLSPMGIMSPIADIGRKTRRASMQVMRGGAAVDAGGAPAEIGFPLSLDPKTADASRLLTERLRVLSVSENDSKLRKYEMSGSDRKANLDLTAGAKSRFRRTRRGETREADFDNFDYKGPLKDFVKKTSTPVAKVIPALAPAPETSNKLTLKSSKKDTTTKRSAASANRRSSAQSSARLADDESSQQASRTETYSGGNSFDPFADGQAMRAKNNNRHNFDDEQSHLSEYHDTSSVTSQPTRIAVNLALNEDLTCAYKMSQLTSCCVEGFLQVSVKSSMRVGSVPFSLIIRDPANQIEAISENKKIVQDVSHILTAKEESEHVRNKYVINVPKFDTYFAIMKYQCVGELRPVPIRVQTKVKSDGGICRVALQISSNPNNGASLTDLTIVMGVPQKVRGQSLVTQPPGGVWDEGKSSVIWCVSELGSGEKFQLQARFEMMKSDVASNDLNFPVLVRCQCLFAQLSAVEVETREIADVIPLEIVTKVARRYRLSHREKNG